MSFASAASTVRLDSPWKKQKVCRTAVKHASGNVLTSTDELDLWNSIYRNRISRLNKRSAEPCPPLFPGVSPVLAITVAPENYSFERWLAISTFIQDGSTKHATTFEHAVQTTMAEILELSEQVKDRDTAATLLNCVHKAWTDSPAPDYSEAALDIVQSELQKIRNDNELPIIFELEEFASYSSLRSTLGVVRSARHQNHWLEIAYPSISSIRASKQCLALGLSTELEKLASGRMVPIIVNEFGCVADGNHRLTASWIWNALHYSADHKWVRGDLPFEQALHRFAARNRSLMSNFAITSALSGLSTLLDDPTSELIVNKLRSRIATHSIERLPVVPMLSYCGFAVERSDSADGIAEGLRRFNPNAYAELLKNSTAYLPPKACYHLADQSPLPLTELVMRKTKRICRFKNMEEFS